MDISKIKEADGSNAVLKAVGQIEFTNYMGERVVYLANRIEAFRSDAGWRSLFFGLIDESDRGVQINIREMAYGLNLDLSSTMDGQIYHKIGPTTIGAGKGYLVVSFDAESKVYTGSAATFGTGFEFTMEEAVFKIQEGV
ncbi:hypothetical protein ACKJSM_18070 [Pseudomonas sp. PHC1]|uniref:hypothetical protein n=1 Tax=Pseudomonas sp. PHC1 TaxID=3384759 RepID=UPI00396F6D07